MTVVGTEETLGPMMLHCDEGRGGGARVESGSVANWRVHVRMRDARDEDVRERQSRDAEGERKRAE